MLRPAFVLTLLVIFPSFGSGQSNTPGQTRGEAAKADGKPRDYAPGIWIDWSRRLIELEARVALRSGPLELLACSPNTREHESILVVQARPLDIYHAMGLVGLEPGAPIRYDRERERVHPATGQELQLHVRYRENGAERTVPAEHWLLESERRSSPDSVKWVFAGSKSYEDGRFGADVEGTVVCVVDFQSALIAVGALHTADNRLLWLEANTPRIPPIGTACKLVVSGLPDEVIDIEVGAEGTLRQGRTVLSAVDVVRLSRRTEAKMPGATVALHPAPGVAAGALDSAVDSLVRAGLNPRRIIVRRGAEMNPAPAPPSKPTPGG